MPKHLLNCSLMQGLHVSNKNVHRKSVRSRLCLEASMRELYETKQESNKPLATTDFEFDEDNIMSRRPTKLMLQLLSREREKKGKSLPISENDHD